MLQGKPTRHHHGANLKAKNKVFIDVQGLHRELTQVLQHQALQLSVFHAQKTHLGCHSTVTKKWNYRSQKVKLVHLGTLYSETFLGPWTMFLPVWAGVGAYMLGFKVVMVSLTWCRLF